MFSFFDKKIWENLDKYVYSSVISTNFAILEEKFTKISTSQIWKKKTLLQTSIDVQFVWEYVIVIKESLKLFIKIHNMGSGLILRSLFDHI
jgi:hypothetical protein